MQVFRRLCQSFGASVRPSTGPLVHASFWCLSHDRPCVSEHGIGEGMDGDCMPLPTRPQRYCDPASHLHFDGRKKSPKKSPNTKKSSMCGVFLLKGWNWTELLKIAYVSFIVYCNSTGWRWFVARSLSHTTNLPYFRSNKRRRQSKTKGYRRKKD